MLEMLKALKEVGIPIGAFALSAWVVMYIVKKVAVSLDKLCIKIDKHEAEADVRAKFVREEHRQMIEALGRINGYVK